MAEEFRSLSGVSSPKQDEVTKTAGSPRRVVQDDYHAAVMARAIRHKITVEDLARAWASIDGKRDLFDAEKGVSVMDVVDGHYLGYMAEAAEVLCRAATYAQERKS